MKIENGRILEATETELYDFYLTRDWYELYPFPEYKQLCAKQGTKIVKEGERNDP